MTISFRLTWPRVLLGLLVFAVIGGFVFPFLAWLVADQGIAATSESDFCVSCHTMEPMEAAYLQDVHGGNSPYGVQAACVDCHLNHANSAAYFFDKIRTGSHDMWVQYMTDTSQIDWVEKREHRESYTYDSGCLHCHAAARGDHGQPKAFVATSLLPGHDRTHLRELPPERGPQDLLDHLPVEEAAMR
ncbi:MAG: NapC/NirT family cytochrome c [Caldilineaceae bacterium]